MEKPISPLSNPALEIPPPPTNTGALSAFTDNPIISSIRSVYNAFSDRRAKLGLSNPGTMENIAKEVQRDVLLNNQMFSGLRADLTRAMNAAPLFQTAHNFTMGSGGMTPYSFAALFGNPKIFLQGNIDSDFQLSARANYRWTSNFVTKTNVSLAPGGSGQAMVQLENDYQGADFSANVKAMNPSILEGPLTGIFMASYLQSVTPSLALGVEMMWQRAAGTEAPQAVMSYAARYRGNDWVWSGQLLAQGGIQTSYWRRLAERVEAGVDLNLQFVGLTGNQSSMLGPARNEGTATLGAKYEFRTAVFRGQVDSQGKVSCLLEKRVSQPVMVTFAGELDHSKNTAKVGVAISLENSGEEVMEQQERMQGIDIQPPPF